MDIQEIDSNLKNNEDGLFFERLTLLLKSIGFNYCAYGVRPIYSSSNQLPKIINNYSDKWTNTYVANNYFDVDPVVKHALTSTQPMIWRSESFTDNRYFWDEAEGFKINAGFSYPHRDLNGRVGMLTFAGDDKSHADIVAIAPTLAWIAHTSHIELANSLLPISEQLEAFTKKERDILLFTAEGKTTHEIAQIMHLSESGINYYFVNIFKKLSVKSKQEAIAKSLAFNLIY